MVDGDMDGKGDLWMLKSFQESNGTVLSTNWNEVGAKPVETQPPEGMEVKKY